MRDMKAIALCVVAVMGLAGVVMGEEMSWKAGVARVRITPDKAIWMTGYGSRVKVSEGVAHELYAKALALRDEAGKAGVIVCADLLGWPAGTSQRIASEIERRFGISRDRLVLSCTHTHGGPALWHPHQMLYGVRATEAELRDVEQYTQNLERKVVDVVGDALKGMRTARVSFGHGESQFVMNRRKKTDKGYVIDVDPGGPVDRDVPVLRAEQEDGKLLAVLFAYACHNTTVGGDCYEFHGDYAGFATASIEQKHPGAVAMFAMGCGSDANPQPRGTIDLAREHGEELAAAVEKTIAAQMTQVRGNLRTAMGSARLAFAAAPTRKDLETQLEQKDIYYRWQAKELLKQMDRDGGLASEYPCPVQVWRLGDQLMLITIGGEVVVDYALRLKKELGAEKLWVAGYCNDVFAYVPSKRVLEEGGYEGEGAMVYYVQPGKFAPTVEETILSKVHELVAETGTGKGN